VHANVAMNNTQHKVRKKVADLPSIVSC
jgi:hypothetical protein